VGGKGGKFRPPILLRKSVRIFSQCYQTKSYIFAKEIDFCEPLKNNATQAAEKAQQWAKEIIQNMKNS